MFKSILWSPPLESSYYLSKMAGQTKNSCCKCPDQASMKRMHLGEINYLYLKYTELYTEWQNDL